MATNTKSDYDEKDKEKEKCSTEQTSDSKIKRNKQDKSRVEEDKSDEKKTKNQNSGVAPSDMEKKEKEKTSVMGKTKKKAKNSQRPKKKEDSKMGEFGGTLSFNTPKDETELALLQLEPPLSDLAKSMEEYKIAMQQIHVLLIQLMRRGNGTVDFQEIKSDRNQASSEKLYKSVYQATAFWQTASEFQPHLNHSLKTASVQMSAAERYLQEKGPKHLRRIAKFIYKLYPQYVELKKELLKLNKTRPDSIHMKEDLLRKINNFIKENYLNAKAHHVGELQSAMIEIMFFHKITERYWYNIAERKETRQVFTPEQFDFNEFFLKRG